MPRIIHNYQVGARTIEFALFDAIDELFDLVRIKGREERRKVVIIDRVLEKN